jgi:dissimilatory sulfite reductase (desulfoviridin) alpha/beta subunit
MKWSEEAEQAIRKVPFFVRKRVRARVEKEAADAGKFLVTIAEVNATQKRYLSGMEAEMKGYQLDTCFGPSGCPNQAVDGANVAHRIRRVLDAQDLLGFLQKTVEGQLRFHHEFRVAIADCPNACSQVQIKDIGIIGACSPGPTDIDCTACGACEEVCREGALRVVGTENPPVVALDRCVHCGKCTEACPTGSLAPGERGYRVQLGGKLGRHPRLATELPGIYSEDRVVDIVNDCIAFYKRRSRGGTRFSEIIDDRLIQSYLDTGRFPD